MKVLATKKVPIKMWLTDIEEGAMEQAKDLAELPFVHKHVALMPDCHKGYGMPIGGVMACDKVVVPNAVGVDIGCGMCAVMTSLEASELSTSTLGSIKSAIEETIPSGFNHHDKPQEWSGFVDEVPDISVIRRELESARHQIGTLGGGNHFIEIQKALDNSVWIMIHSGSRNFGYKIAKEYHSRAECLCNRWFSKIPNKDLSFIPIEEKDAKEYLTAMGYALKFAKANRDFMMYHIKKIICDTFPDVTFGAAINIHHNYAAWEYHYGKQVLVHRKGAISAKEGQLGIVPGSQGTRSYITRGLGNQESFMSCSHGAGRKMGRAQARRELRVEEEAKKLDDLGILHSIKTTLDLDEAPSAYKDIDEVMENQKDLTEIVVSLEPMAVIKAREE